MDLKKAIETLDGCIPPPHSKMVDVEHAAIANAWQFIRAEITKNCDTCRWRKTDSHKFYTYPCSECKCHARDSYEKEVD